VTATALSWQPAASPQAGHGGALSLPDPGGLTLPDPRCLSLPPKAVQVWVLKESLVEIACRALAPLLAQDELARAGAYRQERHRQRFIARRGLLRWLIALYLDCPARSLRFELSTCGKPSLGGPQAGRLAFSVSQAESMALLAFTATAFTAFTASTAFTRQGAIGVDVEQVVPGIDAAGVAREVFSGMEQKALAAQAGADPGAFFRTWSRKEALLKAVGTGLSGQPSAYTTQDDPENGRWRAWHAGRALSGWTLADLAPGPQVRAALAVAIPDVQVSLHLLS
jgi:4'-phosphopantetheinyl transferase